MLAVAGSSAPPLRLSVQLLPQLLLAAGSPRAEAASRSNCSADGQAPAAPATDRPEEQASHVANSTWYSTWDAQQAVSASASMLAACVLFLAALPLRHCKMPDTDGMPGLHADRVVGACKLAKRVLFLGPCRLQAHLGFWRQAIQRCQG